MIRIYSTEMVDEIFEKYQHVFCYGGGRVYLNFKDQIFRYNPNYLEEIFAILVTKKKENEDSVVEYRPTGIFREGDCVILTLDDLYVPEVCEKIERDYQDTVQIFCVDDDWYNRYAYKKIKMRIQDFLDMYSPDISLLNYPGEGGKNKNYRANAHGLCGGREWMIFHRLLRNV